MLEFWLENELKPKMPIWKEHTLARIKQRTIAQRWFGEERGETVRSSDITGKPTGQHKNEQKYTNIDVCCFCAAKDNLRDRYD